MRDPRFLEGVRRAFRDESEAVEFYRELAELAPNDAIRRAIMNIRHDEMMHRSFFESILALMEEC